MHKIFLIFFAIITLGISSTPKEVLLLHSYHKGYKWTDDISLSVEKNLKEYGNVNITTIYMDTKKIYSLQYMDKLAFLYKEQFKNRKFDLIILSDNNAFDFMIKYHEFLFLNVPVLFCGINNFDKAFLQENSMIQYMTGVVEKVNIEKNLNLILKIHPNLKKLLILNDLSHTGQAVRRDLRNVLPKFKNKIKTIQYIDNKNIKEIQSIIKNSNEKETAILQLLLSYDDNGKYLTNKQSMNKIKNIKNIPIYSLWDYYLDFGIVGGLLTSAKAQGDAVSKMAIDILNGKTIQNIPFLEQSPNKYIFDYNLLEKFNIKIEKYINTYTIVNEPFSFYKEYKDLVNSVTIVFLIFIILIILMRINIQKRKKVQIDLSNRLKFDKVLLDTMPNPIYYKDTKGIFLGCNKAFQKLTNHKKKNIIGKTAFDFFSKKIAQKNTDIDNELLKTLGTCTSEVSIHTYNNEMRHFILNKAVYENIDSSIGGIVCIMDDITERLHQKQFIIQQSKLAEMGDMVAAIAHQWNEPLVELSAQVQSIELSYKLKELQDMQVKNFVQDSMVQIQYMSQTLSDFRNFLKPSTKKALFGLRKAMNEIFEIIAKQIFYSNINLNINYQSQKDNILIFGYENEFKQVLLNLINNAKNKIIEQQISNISKGNIIIDIFCDDEYNHISISDDGGLIDDEIINLIFDPYFTTKKDGTGIGLYMAKVIIEDKMSGKISVKNKNKYVVFNIKIPNSNYKKENL